ncbi:zinc metalloprotease [Brevibacillus migulae]|uniref:M43 family zinc metalloprotease n=1 Tax=Brevibacillus migulae TaxID=1644114 RepID=UPI00106EEBCB|nr:M43 family zinc metalloprotease [Brevibacillus migulae]
MFSRSKFFAIGLFSVVSTLSFLTTNAYAEYLNGKWDDSIIHYEDVNLDSKYSDVLWTAVDKWNGITSEMNIYPADTGDDVRIEVKHLSRDADNQLGWNGTYGLGLPYDEDGNLDQDPYDHAEVILVRYMCDDLDEDDTINAITHEFGHVLGLAHTTKARTDSIMDEDDVFDWDIDGPTSYDENNLEDLYE